MANHPSEVILALYTTGDLDWRDRWQTALHVRTCASCRSLVSDFSADRELRRHPAKAMPLPANWDSLAEEMAANNRHGLEASECVRQVPVASTTRASAASGAAATTVDGVRAGWFWKPTLGIGFSMAVVAVALIASQRGAFERIWNAAAYGVQDTGQQVVLKSSADGVEMQRGVRSSMSLKVGTTKAAQYSARLDGSVRAQYVDDDSFQVTVTNVYAQ